MRYFLCLAAGVVLCAGCAGVKYSSLADTFLSEYDSGKAHKGEVEAALAIYLKTNELNKGKDDPRIDFNIARCYDALDSVNTASMWYFHAIDVDKKFAALALWHKGLLLQRNGKHMHAIQDFSKALGYNDTAIKKPELFFCRGRSYLYLKELDSAMADISRALEIEPGNAAYQNLKKEVLSAGPDSIQTAGQATVGAADIQKIIDDAKSNKVVRIPKGVYELDRSLVIRDKKNITFRCAAGTQILVTDVMVPVVSIQNCEGVVFENALARHKKPLKQYECHGAVFEISGSDSIVVFNCDINGSGAIGVSAKETSRLTVQNCHVHENSFNAFYLDKCSDIVIKRNRIEKNGNLFQCYSINDLMMMNNSTDNNGGYWEKLDPAPGLLPEKQ
jgi:parallel beta-helix repeat protein